MDITPQTLPQRFDKFLMYQDFVSFYVSPVIGLRRFEKEKCCKLYSSYATVSDEAFAVLTLENNWDRWMAMFVSGKWKDSEVRTKYTVTRDTSVSASSGKTKKRKNKPANEQSQTETTTAKPEGGPQARRFRGWSAHGINRYNQLFDQIEKERKSLRGQRFEVELQAFFQKRAAETVNGRKKEKLPVPTLPMPRHEMWPMASVETSVPPPTKESDEEEDTSSEDDNEGDGNC